MFNFLDLISDHILNCSHRQTHRQTHTLTYICIFILVVVSRNNVLALVRLVFTTLSDAMEDNPANRRHFDNNVRTLPLVCVYLCIYVCMCLSLCVRVFMCMGGTCTLIIDRAC